MKKKRTKRRYKQSSISIFDSSLWLCIVYEVVKEEHVKSVQRWERTSPAFAFKSLLNAHDSCEYKQKNYANHEHVEIGRLGPIIPTHNKSLQNISTRRNQLWLSKTCNDCFLKDAKNCKLH